MSKITTEHLARSAYVYIRQSTADQLTHNHESRRRQYGLVDRARQLGWTTVEVIDDDLGRSGGGIARPGFERLLAAICEARVGAVLAIEVSRLARNGRDHRVSSSLAKSRAYVYVKACAGGAMARGYGKLTAKRVEHLSRRGLYGDGGGLYLQVAKGGSKSWLYRFKIEGRTHWHGLGSAGGVSLASARDKAMAARNLRRDGGNPIQAKRAAKAAARVEAAKSITFGAAAKRFIQANRAGWKNSKHADQWSMTLLGIDPNGKPAKNDYCKSIRDLPIGAVDTALVLRIIEAIWATKTETASRIRSRIEAVIDAAKAKGEFRGENPARWKGHLDNLLPATSKVRKVRNHPALPYQQLPDFMRELRQRDGVAAGALEFQILTAVRPGNAVAARWDQIDRQAAVWTIPAALMKSYAEHKVPLSRSALDLVDRMEALREGSEYIFPNAKGKPLSDASMATVIDRMNEQARQWIDPKVDREVVPHGFRSTFRDWTAEHGYDDAVAEAALAHKVSDDVIAAYKRTRFIELRKRMMTDWADYCARPAAGDDNVVPLRA